MHNNCKKCYNLVSCQLFTDNQYQINNKPIYISYNLLYSRISPNNNSLNTSIIEYIYHKRLCFVELDNIILIELEYIGLTYYFNKCPVYNYEGVLMNPRYLLPDLTINPKDYNGSFNPIIIKMLGIGIKLPRNINKELINIAIKNISDTGIKILAFYPTFRELT
jgi:hypothetical protein